MELGQKLYAAKTVSWPGATPFPPPVCGPNPLRGFGGHSRPGCTCGTRSLSVFAAQKNSMSQSQLWAESFIARVPRQERKSHASTETTEPQAAVRKHRRPVQVPNRIRRTHV